ncbi:hypothetical protein [Micromonospora sp. NPDC050200]
MTDVKPAPSAILDDVVSAGYAIAHLDADLGWLRTTLDRVADRHREVHS